jgi:hypothetical protein
MIRWGREARQSPARGTTVTRLDSLLEAYRKTTFYADTPRARLALRVGQWCVDLDALLNERGMSTWAYVTASNPGSRRLSDEDNSARQRELEGDVGRLGVRAYPGEGVADDGRWPPEPSLLILGIARGEAIRLGGRYGQVAIVCGELGRPAELVLCADG